MNSIKILIVIQLLLFSSSQLFAQVSTNGEDLIYGHDDRYEVDDYTNQEFRESALSVAMKVSKEKLLDNPNDNSILNFPHHKLTDVIENICPSEKFLDQYSIGNCSGFLVSKNLLVTAGHCMLSQNDCDENRWVFDYKENTADFKKSNVYSCKKILSQKFNCTDKEIFDYAAIELDRVVVNRKPLGFRKHGYVTVGTPVLVIGHPLGLPMKITDGAHVSRMNNDERVHKIRTLVNKLNYFNANLDSYGGNSGSPVFNKNTGKVEGILIQGANDFVLDQELQCVRSNHLSNSFHNTFEKVMRITKVPGL